MNRTVKLALGSALLAVLLGLGGCTVDREQPPANGNRADVDARGSNLPDYDLGAPDDQSPMGRDPIPKREVDVELRR